MSTTQPPQAPTLEPQTFDATDAQIAQLEETATALGRLANALLLSLAILRAQLGLSAEPMAPGAPGAPGQPGADAKGTFDD